MLERKLERCEYTDLSGQTRERRNELIKEYTKPLLDDEKRKEYERTFKHRGTLNNDTFFLPVAKGYEVAGLLLLLESKQYEECLDLATSYLDSLRNLSYDSKQNIDLYKIIAYSTLEYARELKLTRYFEFSAKVLEHGLRIINSVSVMTPTLEIIRSQLNDLFPYRILDLLSRNTDDSTREKGIESLKKLITDRDGLDGISTLYMNDKEFKAFFRQIRYFLTLQEQIDLYQEWCIGGSESACFLLGISLVACGFSRRKPERLVQALAVMIKLGCDELDLIIKYIHLLLGNVDNSIYDNVKFKSQCSSPLSDVDLAKLCSDCREWLETDVLDGYRDVEIESDLEAYFGDRDVTNFIEEHDIKSEGRIINNQNHADLLNLSNNLFNKTANSKTSAWNKLDANQSNLIVRESQTNAYSYLTKLVQYKWQGILAILITVISLLFLALTKNDPYNIKRVRQPNSGQTTIKNQLVPDDPRKNVKSKEMQIAEMPNQSRLYPSEIEIRSIISKWLTIKTEMLSGDKSIKDISVVATPDAIERLEAERLEDQMRGETQRISAKVINVRILSRQSDKIEVDALLSYSDQRINQKNLIVDRTPQQRFRKRYILVNRNSTWKLQ